VQVQVQVSWSRAPHSPERASGPLVTCSTSGPQTRRQEAAHSTLARRANVFAHELGGGDQREEEWPQGSGWLAGRVDLGRPCRCCP